MNSVEGNTLPEGWKNKKLGDICDVIGGGTPKTKISEYWDGEIVWLSPIDLPPIGEISIVSDSRKKITDLGLNKSSARLLPKGSVVYSTRASIGKIAIAEIPLSTNQGFTNFICNERINNHFLCYSLKHFNKTIEGLSNSTTFKEVSKTAIKSFKIPLPPLEEQKRIVAKIDTLFAKIDKAISLTEESLVQAKNLLPSVLKEVFEKGKADGWEEKKLVDLKESNIIGLVRNAKQQSIDFSFEYVKMNNVTNDNRFTFNNITSVEANEKEVQKFKLAKGDFLFNTRNSFELVGKSCIYDSDKENVLYNNNLMRIRFKNGINPYFILYQFSSPFLISQLRNIKSGTTSVCAIYYQSLKDILLLVSSSDTQDKLVTYFNDVSKQAQQTQSKLKEQLAYLKQLKSSILSKAFKGEL